MSSINKPHIGIWLLWRTPGHTRWLRCNSMLEATEYVNRHHIMSYYIVCGTYTETHRL